MEGDRFGVVTANPDWRSQDYIWAMENRLGVTVESGARQILESMPGNTRYNRCEMLAAWRGEGDPLNMEIASVAARAMERFRCGIIPSHLVPAACPEIVRKWKDRKSVSHILVFHEPVWVRGDQSILSFRALEGGGVALGHADAKGTWFMGDVLSIFSLPPRQR